MPRRLHTALFLILALGLLAASCGDDDDDGAVGGSDAVADSDADAGSDAAAADLRLAAADPGDVLVDAEGNSVYLFVPDAQGESTCYDACEANWPPLPALDAVGDGLDQSLLGTTTRTDGTEQATYNGWPLYYFANDAAAGDTNGQGVNDVWYLVDASGDAVGAG